MKRWLLIFMVLGITAQADSWLDSRTDYYVAARVKLGLDVAESGLLNDTTASFLFNEAATAILPIHRGVKRVTSFVTSYRESMYAFDSTLVGIQSIWWAKNDSIKPLAYLPLGSWDKQTHRTTFGKTGFEARPSYYDQTDSVVIIYPPPVRTTADTIKILGWHRLPDIDTTTAPTLIPERYRLAILYHMVWNQARARHDSRAPDFREELIFALSQIGLKLTDGGEIAKSGL